MATESHSWQPDWIVAPGDILQEALDERGLSQSELARMMDRPTKTINEIVNGKAAITPDTAIQLERTLGIEAALWNRLEVSYREGLARHRQNVALSDYKSWVAEFPIKDMVRWGLFEKPADTPEAAESLLRFFRVATPQAWSSQWSAVEGSFRRSTAFATSPKALAVWLQWGERTAEDIPTAAFDPSGLLRVVTALRGETRNADTQASLYRARTLLADAGVAFVWTPELPGTHVSGVARWLTPIRAIVQVSMRYKTSDQLWFTIFHECGHVSERKRLDFIDEFDKESTDDVLERRADQFARNTLIPPSAYQSFVAEGDFKEPAIRAFAQLLGIGTGLVVGRLQHDDHLNPGQLSRLRKKVNWTG